MKTYIVLPFKDRRGKFSGALDKLIDPFKKFLDKNLNYNYELLIVEQTGGSLKDTLPKYYKNDFNSEFFNFGRTINVGFDLIKDNLKSDDIFIYHPVDLLPPKNANFDFTKTTKIFSDHYKGYWKAIAFSIDDFIEINGFSNKYWGWGIADLDLDVRLNLKNIEFHNVNYDFELLCTDGNHLDDETLFAPLCEYNWIFLDELKQTQNCEVSGINNLNYELLKVEDFHGIHKYVIL